MGLRFPLQIVVLFQPVRSRWTERQKEDVFDRPGDQSSRRIRASVFECFQVEDVQLE